MSSRTAENFQMYLLLWFLCVAQTYIVLKRTSFIPAQLQVFSPICMRWICLDSPVYIPCLLVSGGWDSSELVWAALFTCLSCFRIQEYCFSWISWQFFHKLNSNMGTDLSYLHFTCICFIEQYTMPSLSLWWFFSFLTCLPNLIFCLCFIILQ